MSGRKVYSVPIQIQSVYRHKHCTAVFAIACVWWVYKVDGRRSLHNVNYGCPIREERIENTLDLDKSGMKDSN